MLLRIYFVKMNLLKKTVLNKIKDEYDVKRKIVKYY